MTSPTANARDRDSALALVLGCHSRSRAAARIRSRVWGASPGRSLSANDTAPLDTPARRATSMIVGSRRAGRGPVDRPLLGSWVCRTLAPMPSGPVDTALSRLVNRFRHGNQGDPQTPRCSVPGGVRRGPEGPEGPEVLGGADAADTRERSTSDASPTCPGDRRWAAGGAGRGGDPPAADQPGPPGLPRA